MTDTDTDRVPTPSPADLPRSISDLPAPREPGPDAALSQGSTGAADVVPPDAIEESTRTGAPIRATDARVPEEGAPAEGDPALLPRDDVPPVGSIVPDDLPSEDVNVPDPDGPDEAIDARTGDAEELHTSGL